MIPETAIVPRNSSRMRPLVAAFVGVPILALLSFFWLEVPDSHIWQLVFSLFSGALLALALVWLGSAAVRALRNTATPCSRWLSAVLLAAWLLFMWIVIHLASQIDDNASARAGYFVSKQSAHARTVLTYDRLIAWQHDFVLLLLWIVIPALVTPLLIETVTHGLGGPGWRTASSVLRRWQHWLTVIACNVSLYWLTGRLTGWRPSNSVHGEIISLAVRLCICYLADFLLICLLVAVDSRLLAREHLRRYAAAQPSADVT